MYSFSGCPSCSKLTITREFQCPNCARLCASRLGLQNHLRGHRWITQWHSYLRIRRTVTIVSAPLSCCSTSYDTGRYFAWYLLSSTLSRCTIQRGKTVIRSKRGWSQKSIVCKIKTHETNTKKYYRPVSRRTFCSWCKSLICFCNTTDDTPAKRK